MKNTTAMVPAALRASCNATSTISRLAHSIAAGIMQLMTAGILGTLATFILAAPAAADTIPASTTIECSGTFLIGPVNHSQSCSGIYGEFAIADVGGTSARAAGTALDGTASDQGPRGSGGAFALTTYYFDVLATGNFDFNLKVPVLIDALLTTGTTGDENDFLDHTYAEADLNIQTGNIGDFATLSCSGFRTSGFSCDGLSTVSVSQSLDLFPQSTNQVSLTASIILQSQLQSSASASADPFIRIDPAFLADHPGYSLVFSTGVTNGPPLPSAVPEPATAWLLGIGLLVLIAFKEFSSSRFGMRSLTRNRRVDSSFMS